MKPNIQTPTLIHDDDVGLADIVRFFQRHSRTILLTSLVAGVLTALLTVVFTPREYEASATLVLMPPRLSSELKPQLMSIQGLQRLVESDATIDETTRRLVEIGVLKPDDKPLGDGLQTQIYVARRSEATTLAPVIELAARGTTAEKAAAIANTWADVFLKRNQELQNQSTTANIGLVEAQFEESSKRVLELDKERLETEESMQAQLVEAKVRWRRALDETQVLWDRRIVKLKKETEDQLTLFQLETRREMESFAQSQGLPVEPPEVDDHTTGRSTEPSTIGPKAEKRLFQALTLRTQLAQTLQFLSLEKAISNDALWQATILNQSQLVDLQSSMHPNLLTQEINPVYTEITKRLSEVEVELETLVNDGRELCRRIIAGMEEVQRQRSAGLINLLAKREQDFDEMRKEKSRHLTRLSLDEAMEIDALQRRRDTHLEQLDRSLASARELFTELARRFNQADLARGAQDLADLRLAAQAVVPREPRSRILIPKIAIGIFLGMLLGVTAGIVREVK